MSARWLTQRLGGLSLVTLSVLGASATQRASVRADAPPAAPVLQMRTTVLQAELREGDAACRASEHALVVEHGAVPKGATPLVRLRLSAVSPQPLSLLERALRERAQRYCADGLAILRAEAAPGAQGVRAAVAVAWRAPASAPVAADAEIHSDPHTIQSVKQEDD